MITIFEQIINKYRNKTVEIELKFRELWNIRNLYKIRRPDHIGTTMLGVSILPFIAFATHTQPCNLLWERIYIHFRRCWATLMLQRQLSIPM